MTAGIGLLIACLIIVLVTVAHAVWEVLRETSNE